MNLQQPQAWSAQGVGGPQNSPVNGLQALYLLALMAQLAQAAQVQGGQPGQPGQPGPAVQPGQAGYAVQMADQALPTGPAAANAGAPAQGAPAPGGLQVQQADQAGPWGGWPGQGGYPGHPVQGAAPAPGIAGVSPASLPAPPVFSVDLPLGVQERHYWYGGGLPGWPTNPLRRLMSGPIRSAWSL